MTTTAYPEMGPGRPSRVSELVMEPDNDRLRARRRAALLAAFDALPADYRADLLEAAENNGVARHLFEAMYVAAGWGTIVHGRYHEGQARCRYCPEEAPPEGER